MADSTTWWLGMATVTAVAVAGGVLVYHGRRRHLRIVVPDVQRHPWLTDLESQAALVEASSASDDDEARDSGVHVEGDRIVVESYDKMLTFFAEAFEQARIDGLRGPEQILAIVFRRALPRYRWPPLSESPLAPQWQAMIKDVAALFEPEPDPQRRPQRVLR
jgi:hypothetical protein